MGKRAGLARAHRPTDLGILCPPIFTMLVLMTLVTTGMTGPLLGLSDHLRARHALRA